MFSLLKHAWFEHVQLPGTSRIVKHVKSLGDRLGEVRIAFVKQDVQDDLYCCPRGSSNSEIVLSTLMRSGPVALFTRLHAEFFVVKTVADPECQAWSEKAIDLGWYDLKSLEALREQIPGRDYGQTAVALECETVDWSEFDIVVSLDMSVPQRITKAYPNTLWCYYIREPKTRSYTASRQAPLPGQDIFLNQTFKADRSEHKRHSLCFPYYLQYYGCFHDLLGQPICHGPPKPSLFLEHQTPQVFSAVQLAQLKQIGPLDSTSSPDPDLEQFADPNEKCQRSLREILSVLMSSKYFLALPNHRMVWANAAVEAVAAGALVIGNPKIHVHADLFSGRTSVASFDELLIALQYFECNPIAYDAELKRQRRVIDYLCYWRPVRDLLQALAEKRSL
jgi:hypothetical protein